MRDYELTVVLKPDLADKAREEFLAKVKKLVEDAKGKIESQDLWGKKTLAYPLKKEKEGVYAYFVLTFPKNEISSLERKIKIEDGVLRHLLVSRD
ncbi:MAG: 30S ribosomal protein S6 [bacterium]|nr:30S ribosomal protein S6 [bacterium]